MSQFPLGAALNPTGAPRNVTLTGGGQRSVVGRVAPGLAIRPPTSPNVTTAGQLSRVAGSAAGMVRSALAYQRSELQQRLNALAQQERETRRREAAELDDMQNAQRLLTGVGLSEAQTRLADLDVRLGQGEFDEVLGGDVPIGDIAREIADSVQLTDGLHSFAAQRARQAITERLTATLGRRRQGVYEQQREATSFAWRTALVSGEDATATLNDAMRMWNDVPREQFEAEIFVPAMREAASIGRAGVVEDIASVLGNRFLGEQDRARRMLANVERSARSEVERAARDEVERELSKYERARADGSIQTEHLDTTQKRLDEAVNGGAVDPTFALSMQTRIANERRNAEAAIQAQQIQQAIDNRRIEVLQQDFQDVMSGRAHSIGDLSETIGDRQLSVSRDARLDAVMEAAYDQYAQEFGEHSREHIRLTVETAARANQPVPQFRRLLAQAASVSQVRLAEAGSVLPEEALRGAQVYGEMLAVNPAMADKHVLERDRVFFDHIRAERELLGTPVPESVKNAAAARDMQGRIEPLSMTTKELIEQANNLDGWFESNAKNPTEVASMLRRMVDVYRRSGRFQGKELEQATKVLKERSVKINGYVIPSRAGDNVFVPSQGDINKAMVWIRHDARPTFGLDEDDMDGLHLRPMPDGSMVLVDAMSSPVSGGIPTTFTTQQIAEFAQLGRNLEEFRIEDKAIARSQSRAKDFQTLASATGIGSLPSEERIGALGSAAAALLRRAPEINREAGRLLPSSPQGQAHQVQRGAAIAARLLHDGADAYLSSGPDGRRLLNRLFWATLDDGLIKSIRDPMPESRARAIQEWARETASRHEAARNRDE